MSAGAAAPRPRLRVVRAGVAAADGLVLVDKPQGVTSHDVVGALRRLAATRRVGHAGTLDPMATGLLVLGVGRATRFLTYLVGADKTYEATVRLGQETLTEDADGEVTASAGCRLQDLAAGRLEEALRSLTGEIMQVPSAVSAIRTGGVRSYARVRAGQDVELAARPVTIYAQKLLGVPRPALAPGGVAPPRAGCAEVVDIDLEISCSSGTYVRALARDLGRALGCGAHLTTLRRTLVGPFDCGEAVTLEGLSAQVEADAASGDPQGLAVLPLGVAARRCLPTVRLTTSQARALGYGQPLDAVLLDQAQVPERPVTSKTAQGQDVVAGLDPDGSLVALLARRGASARPVLVLAPA
ncbi:tRNA pseudouridine(55) synthase TruB [Actinomyces wuliandei]|uniref:tRNA pseudouridine(55) synthase TruB n=1 Tax=Actinomyces wuliandei TaxID=2057743 RepID=UPI00214B33CE|nr:tRNA pseudouridine(55) synthase TruB [Actinomyces wuliandei]